MNRVKWDTISVVVWLLCSVMFAWDAYFNAGHWFFAVICIMFSTLVARIATLEEMVKRK